MLSIGLCAQIACIWETTARNPGNVHRYSDFADIGYVDFLLSAAAIAPVLEKAPAKRVGDTVLDGVRATQRVAKGNANLGILLLLAPLARVPRERALQDGIEGVLDDLDVTDSRAVYEAIRLASPAGLGEVAEQDIRDEPTEPLRQIMRRAADRDLIARQYANGFREVFEDGIPAALHYMGHFTALEDALIALHLHFMASYPDTLIARKRGLEEARESARRAKEVLDSGWPTEPSGQEAIDNLDEWLRAAGRGRNPGTTSDLVTACLFALLREGKMEVPK